LPVRPSLL